jgi:hypothetical protein
MPDITTGVRSQRARPQTVPSRDKRTRAKGSRPVCPEPRDLVIFESNPTVAYGCSRCKASRCTDPIRHGCRECYGISLIPTMLGYRGCDHTESARRVNRSGSGSGRTSADSDKEGNHGA